MPELIAYLTAAAVLGLIAAGHIVVLRIIFTSTDHADRKLEKAQPRGLIPDVSL